MNRTHLGGTGWMARRPNLGSHLILLPIGGYDQRQDQPAQHERKVYGHSSPALIGSVARNDLLQPEDCFVAIHSLASTAFRPPLESADSIGRYIDFIALL